VVEGLGLPNGIHLTIPVMVTEHIGHKSHVDHQLTNPKTLFLLKAKQMFLSKSHNPFDSLAIS
jgi:hypothetical protein